MNNERLEDLLRQIATEDQPLLPKSLVDGILESIAQRPQGSALSAWIQETFALLLRPRWALAGAALAILIGAVGESVASSRANFSDAMGLGVFSSCAPTLPSTHLGHDHE